MATRKGAVAQKRAVVPLKAGPWRYMVSPGTGGLAEVVCGVSPEDMAGMLSQINSRRGKPRWDAPAEEICYLHPEGKILVVTTGGGYPVLMGWVPFEEITFEDGRVWTIFDGWREAKGKKMAK